MNKETLKEAIEIFGRDIIAEVVSMVQLFDADGCYTTFQDMGKDDHAEAVEFLYFN